MKTYAIIAALVLSQVPNFKPAPVPPIQPTSTLDRLDIKVSVDAVPSEKGQFGHYVNHGGYEWRNDTPDWLPFGKPEGNNPGRPIIAEMQGDIIPRVVWFDGVSFISSSGGKWKTPVRWYYHRPQEEVIRNGSWVLPDGTLPPMTETVTLRADNMQGIVDYLMARNTVQQIQDMMDKSTEYFPKNGAPEQ